MADISLETTFTCQSSRCDGITYLVCIRRQLSAVKNHKGDKFAEGKKTFGAYYEPCFACTQGLKIKELFSPGIITEIKDGARISRRQQAAKGVQESRTRHQNKGASPYSSKFVAPKKKITESHDGEKVETSQMEIGSVIAEEPRRIARNARHKEASTVQAPPPNLYDLELLLKGQVSYIFSLAHEGQMKEARSRLKLTINAMREIVL